MRTAPPKEDRSRRWDKGNRERQSRLDRIERRRQSHQLNLPTTRSDWEDAARSGFCYASDVEDRFGCRCYRERCEE
jgi:hypothetical protein